MAKYSALILTVLLIFTVVNASKLRKQERVNSVIEKLSSSQNKNLLGLNINQSIDEDDLIDMLQSLYSSNAESLELNEEDMEYLKDNCEGILFDLEESIEGSQAYIAELKGTLSITTLEIEYSATNLLDVYNAYIEQEEMLIDGLLGIYANKESDYQLFSTNLAKYLTLLYEIRGFITSYDLVYAEDAEDDVEDELSADDILLQVATQSRDEKLNLLKKFSFLQEDPSFTLAETPSEGGDLTTILPGITKSLISSIEVSQGDHSTNLIIIDALNDLIDGILEEMELIQKEVEEFIASLDSQIEFHHSIITGYKEKATALESQIVVLESTISNTNSMLSSYNAELESTSEEYDTETSFCEEQQVYYNEQIEVLEEVLEVLVDSLDILGEIPQGQLEDLNAE